MGGKTGPTSSAGKSKVSGNAVKHGLRASKWLEPDEKKAFDELVSDLMAEYAPSTATQRILVERIAMCTTKLRRLQVIEDARFQKARSDDIANMMNRMPNCSGFMMERAGAAALPPLAILDTLARYQTTLDRQISRSIGELMVLKANEKVVLTVSPATIAADTKEKSL